MRDPDVDELLEDPRRFLAYVRLHATTPRALFHVVHVNRLLSMAGLDQIEIREGDPEDVFLVLRSEAAEPLVLAAEAGLEP